MALVAQHADQLGGECFIQRLDHVLAVGGMAGSDRTILDMRSRALAQGLDVGKRRPLRRLFIEHSGIPFATPR
jgi:hypothetical protein